MSKLKGKVAWVTGAGSGIGLAGAQALAQAGAVVVMSGRRADVLTKEAEAIRAAGGAEARRRGGRARQRQHARDDRPIESQRCADRRRAHRQGVQR